MGRRSNEFNKGYQEAIEAIKKKLDEMNGSSSDSSNMNGNSNSNGGDSNGKSQNNDMISPEDAIGGQGNKGQKNNKSNNGSGQSGSGSGSGEKSRTSKSDENQGVVRPEDCRGNMSGDLSNVPSNAGGMISQDVGEKLAKSEGYDPEGGTENAVEKDWAETAVKESNKFKSDLPGSLVSAINDLYKVATDWKKVLKKIVGNSISPDDKRQAYANKNILVSQDRIARTDKDKWENVDYMMAWVDSSGSMSDDQLKQCLSEVYAVALAKKPLKLVVIQCDTQIQEIKEYKSVAELKKSISHATVKGRGGTELKPCWNLLQNDPKYKRRPAELVMIFTDGYLNQYKRNPRTMKNLCWVILDNPAWNIQYKDTNTKVIHIKSSDIK